LNGQCESWREREPLNRFRVEVRGGHLSRLRLERSDERF